MKNPFSRIKLASEVSVFERSYLRRINRIALWFFIGHLPVFTAIAYFNETGPLLAVALTMMALLGPILAHRTFEHPRLVSHVHGFTAMIMGGLLVHFGQGPVQIEMHFYFFALLAMLALFGNPSVVITAAVTVAAHHALLWLLLPQSVFNYDAPLWVVAVHAVFVVVESAAVCFIARSFHDNVIGLDKIVQDRTRQLDARNEDMRLVLDNVAQGFVTLDRDGVMTPERSAIVSTWLGDAPESGSFADYLEKKDARAASTFRMAWEQLADGLMPIDVSLDLLATEAKFDGKYFHLEYRPIGVHGDDFDKILVVVSDVSSDVERARMEVSQREVMHIFERVIHDRHGFVEFYEEASELIENLMSNPGLSPKVRKRVVHTLKGNAMVFGVNTIATLCHELETTLSEDLGQSAARCVARIGERWSELKQDLGALLGDRDQQAIEIDDTEYQRILSELLADAPKTQLVRRVKSWKLEPTARRLGRIADQATRIAARLNKSNLVVEVEDNGLRVSPKRWAPFWGSLIHVVRNAVDHGLEAKEQRQAANKPTDGRLLLSTSVEDHRFVVAISDDGRGIDWRSLADRAKAAGMEVDTEGALEAALFQEGVSTAQEVTEYSGRGVGMAAARAACIDLGGEVVVQSQPGTGTRVAFYFPEAEMAQDPLVHNQAA